MGEKTPSLKNERHPHRKKLRKLIHSILLASHLFTFTPPHSIPVIVVASAITGEKIRTELIHTELLGKRSVVLSETLPNSDQIISGTAWIMETQNSESSNFVKKSFDENRLHFTLRFNLPPGTDPDILAAQGKELVLKNIFVQTPEGRLLINLDNDPDKGHWRNYEPYGPEYYQFTTTMAIELATKLALLGLSITDPSIFQAEWKIVEMK